MLRKLEGLAQQQARECSRAQQEGEAKMTKSLKTSVGKVLATAIVLTFAMPVLASDVVGAPAESSFVTESEENQNMSVFNESDPEALPDGAILDQADEGDELSPEGFPPPHGRGRWTCIAVDRMRRRFVGNGFSIGEARARAYNHCMRSHFPGPHHLHRGCHIRNCYRHGW